MKLVAAIVQDDDAGGLVDALVRRGLGATRLDTAGGFLKDGNATILTGVEEHQIETVLDAVQSTCRTRIRLLTVMPSTMDLDLAIHLPEPVEIEIGGATVFILDVEKFVHL